MPFEATTAMSPRSRDELLRVRYVDQFRYAVREQLAPRVANATIRLSQRCDMGNEHGKNVLGAISEISHNLDPQQSRARAEFNSLSAAPVPSSAVESYWRVFSSLKRRRSEAAQISGEVSIMVSDANFSK